MHPHSRAGYPRLCITPWAPPAPRHSPGGCEHSPCCSHALRSERRGWGHPRAQPCWEQQQSGVGIPHDSKAKGGPTRPPPRGVPTNFGTTAVGDWKAALVQAACKGRRRAVPTRSHPQGPGTSREGVSPPAGAGRDDPGSSCPAPQPRGRPPGGSEPPAEQDAAPRAGRRFLLPTLVPRAAAPGGVAY